MSARDPLAGVELLLVDGNNLLHREQGAAGAGAVRVLLARLQSAVRAPVHTIVVLDGYSAPGSPPRQRVSARLEVRHAGSRSADDLIVQLAAAQAPADRARTLVVSDDRALADRSRGAGCRTQRLAWLQELLRPAAARGAPIGRPNPPPRAGDDAQARPDDETERAAWQPGRGATKKRGNPRRRRRGA